MNSWKEFLLTLAAGTWPLFPVHETVQNIPTWKQAHHMTTMRKYSNIKRIFAVIHIKAKSDYMVAHVTAGYKMRLQEIKKFFLFLFCFFM